MGAFSLNISESEENAYVYIYVNGLDSHILSQIKAGIEEEGGKFEVFRSDDWDAGSLAVAAKLPALPDLDAGTCINGAELRQAGSNGILMAVYNGSEHDFRIFGANAARFIKRLPLRMG